jgi:outer membrane protein OmpA-like peptidoglycan-associated protein
LRLAPGAPVNPAPYVAAAAPTGAVSAAAGSPAEKGAVGRTVLSTINFATGSANLDERATQAIQAVAASLKNSASAVTITGYTDRTGNHDANVELARQRAIAVRDALVKTGVGIDRLQLKEPLDITGSGNDTDARRVDILATA